MSKPDRDREDKARAMLDRALRISKADPDALFALADSAEAARHEYVTKAIGRLVEDEKTGALQRRVFKVYLAALEHVDTPEHALVRTVHLLLREQTIRSSEYIRGRIADLRLRALRVDAARTQGLASTEGVEELADVGEPGRPTVIVGPITSENDDE